MGPRERPHENFPATNQSMPAVHLDEAWGTASPAPPESTPSPLRARSTMAASIFDEEPDAPPPAAAPQVVAAPAEGGDVRKQLELMRQEQARRSSLQVMISCLLFAMLFHHINRLQGKLQALHHTVLELGAASFPERGSPWRR